MQNETKEPIFFITVNTSKFIPVGLAPHIAQDPRPDFSFLCIIDDDESATLVASMVTTSE